MKTITYLNLPIPIWPTKLCPLSQRFPNPKSQYSPIKKGKCTIARGVEQTSAAGGEGAAKETDGSIEYLSLEYESVWDTKPAWCQPWTIALTGATAIGLSWLILHSIVVTAFVSSVIGVWWYVFLYSYPKAYTDMITERNRLERKSDD